jgi:hypothetical protein
MSLGALYVQPLHAPLTFRMHGDFLRTFTNSVALGHHSLGLGNIRSVWPN